MAFSFLSIKNNGFDDRIHVFLKNQARENLWEKVADENGICFNRVDNFCNFKILGLKKKPDKFIKIANIVSLALGVGMGPNHLIQLEK